MESKRRLAGSLIILVIIAIIFKMFIPKIFEIIYEWPVKVPVSSSHLYELDFSKDWGKIQRKLGLREGGQIDDFEIKYEENGRINSLKYKIINSDELVVYYVNLLIESNAYKIKPQKIDGRIHNNHLVTGTHFFEMISKINLKEIKPVGNCETFILDSRGKLVNYAVEDQRKYLIKENGTIEEIVNTQLPVQGYLIRSSGLSGEKNMNNQSDVCEGVMYLFK
jgi:hypothetical protein